MIQGPGLLPSCRLGRGEVNSRTTTEKWGEKKEEEKGEEEEEEAGAHVTTHPSEAPTLLGLGPWWVFPEAAHLGVTLGSALEPQGPQQDGHVEAGRAWGRGKGPGSVARGGLLGVPGGGNPHGARSALLFS